MTDLRQQCFNEARERELRYNDALTLGNMNYVGATLDELARKAAQQHGPQYRDSRMCGCCGARWGKCEHTSEEAE